MTGLVIFNKYGAFYTLQRPDYLKAIENLSNTRQSR